MEYIKIPPNRFNDVIEHLRYTFFADEPLNKSVQLCKPGEGHAESEKYSLKTLEDGLSVMAVTQDQEVIIFTTYIIGLLFVLVASTSICNFYNSICYWS